MRVRVEFEHGSVEGEEWEVRALLSGKPEHAMLLKHLGTRVPENTRADTDDIKPRSVKSVRAFLSEIHFAVGDGIAAKHGALSDDDFSLLGPWERCDPEKALRTQIDERTWMVIAEPSHTFERFERGSEILDDSQVGTWEMRGAWSVFCVGKFRALGDESKAIDLPDLSYRTGRIAGYRSGALRETQFGKDAPAAKPDEFLTTLSGRAQDVMQIRATDHTKLGREHAEILGHEIERLQRVLTWVSERVKSHERIEHKARMQIERALGMVEREPFRGLLNTAAVIDALKNAHVEVTALVKSEEKASDS